MNVLKKLSVTIGDERVVMTFGHPDTEAELKEVFRLRHAVYAKYGYLNPDHFPEPTESDMYDANGQCVYFAAMIGERAIGFVRLVRPPLPIHKAYTFETPKELDGIEVCELGRLVVDRYSDGVHTPRNIILLFLTLCLAEYCEQNGIHYAYAFLKKKLMGKLKTLGMPFTLITPFTLEYRKDGPMAPYFYNDDDPAEPSYFTLETVNDFLEKTIKSLFTEVEPNHYELQTTLYTRFLKTIGVI